MSQKHSLGSIIFIILTTAATSTLSMLGGLSIELVADKLIPIIPLIIAMPSLSTMIGDYATVVASYEQAGLEGKREQSLYKIMSKSVAINIAGLIVLSLLLAARRGFELDSNFVMSYAAFITSAVLITLIIVFITSNIINNVLRDNKINTEDVLIATITSATNVIMLVMISISVLTIF